MSLTKDAILVTLSRIGLPDGGDLVSRDMIRALTVTDGTVRFVVEAPSPQAARAMEPLRQGAEMAVRAMDGVETVTAVLTAHSGAAGAPAAPAAGQGEPPPLTIGRHPTAQENARTGPQPVDGVARIIAVGSGKGGVGKSTVASNLAVALAKQGRRVGLLDADIYGPSLPRMMGISDRPKSPDGKIIIPLMAHGVTCMSIGLMVDPAKAVVWRGPMLMGALQQMLGQVAWTHHQADGGPLDVLVVDLPPGTGDVQLTLCQKTQLTGAIVVSTPQDVALIDARKALDMFRSLNTPVLGMVENMSLYICPDCGHEAHLFGHGGVKAEAAALGLPFLGALPIDLDTRLAGDGGTPVAVGDGPMARAYAGIAAGLVADGLA